MGGDRVVRRLTVLRDEAEREPVPARKFFHIGQPEVLDDLGECVPMVSWVDDNLARYVFSNAPSSAWGRGSPPPVVIGLPSHAVAARDGVFLLTGPGEHQRIPHPEGKGAMHFIHLGLAGRLWDRGIPRIYLYRLEGLQMKPLVEKKG